MTLLQDLQRLGVTRNQLTENKRKTENQLSGSWTKMASVAGDAAYHLQASITTMSQKCLKIEIYSSADQHGLV